MIGSTGGPRLTRMTGPGKNNVRRNRTVQCAWDYTVPKTLCRGKTALNVRYVNFLVSKPKPCWSEIRVRRGPPLITRSYNCKYVYYYGCILGVFSWRSLYFWF